MMDAMPVGGLAGSRTGSATRESRETRVTVTLDLDGGAIQVDTGIGFLDHMLSAFATHGGFALDVLARGDLDVDAHHTVEDVGIVLGEALRAALRRGGAIERFGDALVPMDEALVQVALDLSGRPYLAWDGAWPPYPAGGLWPDVWPEFFQGLSRGAGLTLHVRLLSARNQHHAAEATFKSLGRALRVAVRLRNPEDGVRATGPQGKRERGEGEGVLPSTKGMVDGWV